MRKKSRNISKEAARAAAKVKEIEGSDSRGRMLYLNNHNYIKLRAISSKQGKSVSRIIDELIEAYIEAMTEK